MKSVPGESGITYKVAEPDEIRQYYNGKIPSSMRALVFYYNGQLSGIAGYRMEGPIRVAFSEFDESLEISKISIVRCAKIVMEFLKEQGVPFFAHSYNGRFLENLGFEKYDTIKNNGECFVCQVT